MFISQALAQTAAAAASTTGTGSFSGMFMQLLLIVAIVYFILIRPQQKRIKKHEAELNAIIKGTTVVVAGLIGRVVNVIDDKTLKVDFGNGMEVKVLRAYVSQVVFESQPETRKK